MNHYFIDNNEPFDIKTFDINLNGKIYRFSTDSGVFSKNTIDFGTLTLINAISLEDKALRFLDLGCGYGAIGIIMKDKYPNIILTQSDINQRALYLCKINNENNYTTSTCIRSDGFKAIDETFDIITLNPPIRAGKEVCFTLYQGAFEHLEKGGSFYIVIQKKQGAPSHFTYLKNLFNNATIVKKNKGYHIIKMIKE